MTRKGTYELIIEAGFGPGEVGASGHLRAAVCAGTATADQLAEYSQYAAKWNRYAELTAERDQAEARERLAPDVTRHDADPDGGLGAAFRAYRDGQSGRSLTVVRPKMIQVDMGEGGMQNLPEQAEWPLYRGSAGSGGAERIRQGLSSNKKR
jgi:hypothetical protein